MANTQTQLIQDTNIQISTSNTTLLLLWTETFKVDRYVNLFSQKWRVVDVESHNNNPKHPRIVTALTITMTLVVTYNDFNLANG